MRFYFQPLGSFHVTYLLNVEDPFARPVFFQPSVLPTSVRTRNDRFSSMQTLAGDESFHSGMFPKDFQLQKVLDHSYLHWAPTVYRGASFYRQGDPQLPDHLRDNPQYASYWPPAPEPLLSWLTKLLWQHLFERNSTTASIHIRIHLIATPSISTHTSVHARARRLHVVLALSARQTLFRTFMSPVRCCRQA